MVVDPTATRYGSDNQLDGLVKLVPKKDADTAVDTIAGSVPHRRRSAA
jgi:hypothetical protein